jgi:hypothetical protein
MHKKVEITKSIYEYHWWHFSHNAYQLKCERVQ